MTNTWNTSLPTIALVIAVAGPAFAQDAKSIAEQGNQKWIQAYAAGDAAALATLYTKDAVLLPQGVAKPLIGEANIRKFYEDSVKQRLTNVSLPVTEAKMVGTDTMFDLGTWTADAPGENGRPTTHVSGTYLNVWQREGSDWRLRADTFNMMPPPAK
jgi:uncharacterized protein (TIGR02246 family)